MIVYILIVVLIYFAASYISVRNNLSQLMQISWSQYFSQSDSRSHTYRVEKMIDENMGIFQEYIIKILEDKIKQNITAE